MAPLLTMTSLGSISWGASVTCNISIRWNLFCEPDSLSDSFSSSSWITRLALWGVSSGGTLGGGNSGSAGGCGVSGELLGWYVWESSIVSTAGVSAVASGLGYRKQIYELFKRKWIAKLKKISKYI